MIGIAITTRNRPEVLRYSLSKFAKFYDEDQLIVVIDDNSVNHEENEQIAYDHGVTYLYNEERMGIPGTKNKGFELLRETCDHQFWFDDDCFPKCDDWTEPFIEAMEYQGHILYLRDWAHIRPILRVKDLTEYSGATACLMTFKESMYNDVTGFSDGYSMYGKWHPDLTSKMFDRGHNLVKYGSLFQIERYIYAFDIDGPPFDFDFVFASCMSEAERKREGKKGR